jgi:hypothetical protein
MRRSPFYLLSLLTVAAPLHAQTLQGRIEDLFRFGTCGQPLCLTVNAEFHGNHFVPEVVQGRDNLIAFLMGSIGASVSTIPISAASGGAVFTFEGGQPVRTEVSSGPIFAERAQTLGRRRLFLGAAASYFNYSYLRGTNLRDLGFTFTHQNVGAPAMGDPTYEHDVIQVRTDLDVSLAVANLVATYGLLDRVDIGVAVPLVRTEVSGTSQAQIIPSVEFPAHRFGTPESPSLTASATTDGSYTGIGDVAIRAKANLGSAGSWQYGALADVRIPTGSEENFAGSGDVSVLGVGILSARYGDFSPHLNAGFAYYGSSILSNSVLATVGFDQLLAPWVTFAMDVISQWPVGETDLRLPAPVTFDLPVHEVLPTTNIQDTSDRRIYGSVGAKFATGSDLRLVVSSLVPLASGGLQPQAAWTVGLERAF